MGVSRAAAAAAAVVGTHDVDVIFAVFLVCNNGVPTALLCARQQYKAECVLLLDDREEHSMQSRVRVVVRG